MNRTLHLYDNNYQGVSIPEDFIEDIQQISNIGSLLNAKDLLVFPNSFSDLKDSIGDLSILSLREGQYADGKCKKVKVCTGNLMGFVGVNDTSVSIHSRFTNLNTNGENDDPSSRDYFLYYMLQKVFSINIFSLEHSLSRDDKILDFLLFMFPQFLKKALSQGLFKEYRKNLHDDNRVKGAIDISRFILNDIPFRGNISYTTREYSYDNSITQLIRHTIEYLKQLPLGNSILNCDSKTISYVRLIVESTPSYRLSERQRVINGNLRFKVHPYFTKYMDLQQLCVHILRHDSLRYGNDKDKIYGILFDGAWLWEEYISLVLPKSFIHYRKDNNKMYLFEGQKQQIVPDYLNKDNGIVADAKYMPLDKNIKNVYESKAKDIYYKTIMYMYRFSCNKGMLIYPKKGDKNQDNKYKIDYTDGEFYELGLAIPQSENFVEFCKTINDNEIDLRKNIEIYSKPSPRTYELRIS